MFVRSRGRTALRIDEVARQHFRVLLTDIDLLGHMNNGRYLSYMDLARVDLTKRTGIERQLTAANVYAVVGQQLITYRKSLNLWQRFDIESRFVGADERSLFIEQRFVVRGEVFARAIVRGRFIQRGVGSVKTAEVARITGLDFAQYPVPERIAEWAAGSALPPTRAEAPSLW